MLSEQPPACAGYPPDRPDPPRYRFMFSLWVKWPEKAVSDSSRGLAQLSCLVQVERAACVTFPLCAVKVTHWTGAVSKNLSLVQFYGHAAANALRQMQAAARRVKGADGVNRCRLAGRIPARCRFRPAGWRSKGGIVLKLRPPSRCSATRCLQRSAPVNGSTVLITGASFRLRSVGRCQRQHGAGGRLCQYRWRRKEKLFLHQKGYLRT